MIEKPQANPAISLLKPATAKAARDPRDPHYQPTQAEMNADVSIPDATPEALAGAVFRGASGPKH